MSPGARALDINDVCIGECGSSITEAASSLETHDSSTTDTAHYDCSHCCHHAHAINTFLGQHTVSAVHKQTFTDIPNSPALHTPSGIKRPPRISA